MAPRFLPGRTGSSRRPGAAGSNVKKRFLEKNRRVNPNTPSREALNGNPRMKMAYDLRCTKRYCQIVNLSQREEVYATYEICRLKWQHEHFHECFCPVLRSIALLGTESMDKFLSPNSQQHQEDQQHEEQQEEEPHWATPGLEKVIRRLIGWVDPQLRGAELSTQWQTWRDK